jgi:hypothetical protein
VTLSTFRWLIDVNPERMTQQNIETLLAAGFATQAMLDRAIRSCVSNGGSLAVHLVLQGVLPDALVARWFARRYQMPLALDADVDRVSTEIARLLPDEVVYEAGLLPLCRWTERSLVVGWVDPTEPGRVEEAEFFSGYTILPHVMTAFQMATAFERVWQRSWKVPSAELLAAKRRQAATVFAAEQLFDWLDLLVTLELQVEQSRQSAPASTTAVDANDPMSGPAHGRTFESRPSGSALRRSRFETTDEEAVFSRDVASELPVRVDHAGDVSGAARDTETVREPVKPPIPQPPVKVSDQTEDNESIKASLITGMFRAPTAEQIELEQARRRLQQLPHYRRSERSGALPSISADTDSHRSDEAHYPPPSALAPGNSVGRPRQVTPASTLTTGSYAAAIPLPVSSGTFHQLPARIFDASGPAQGPVRAAFRSAVKGLNACGSREAIAREIVQSLGIVFDNVLLLQPRLPHLQVWDASLRIGNPRLVGREFEMVDDGFWQRVRIEQLTFRGALLPDDPLRVLIGRELGSDTLVLPLVMNRRTVAILVLDNGRYQQLPSCGGLFKPFDEAITEALRRMIITNKRPQWQPG